MDVELPTTMHIAGGSQTRTIQCWTPSTTTNQFYAWGPVEGTDRWRSTFLLIGNKIVETNNSNSFRNYNLQSWECLDSIQYKPELKGVIFPVISIFSVYLIYRLVFRLLRGKGL